MRASIQKRAKIVSFTFLFTEDIHLVFVINTKIGMYEKYYKKEG